MGLISFIAMQQECQRLRSENSDLKERLAGIEGKLDREIDTNRMREDRLVEAVVSAAGVNVRTPSRATLAARVEEVKQILDAPGEAVDPLDAAVKAAADQFVKQAEENGFEYDAGSRAILENTIRQNPQDYLY